MKNSFGATFIELLVIISVLIILIAISGQVFVFFQKESTLNNTLEEIVSILGLAQNKTLASEEADQYGVYFNTGIEPHEYIIFKGPNFSSRDISFDKVYPLPRALEIYNINLAGGNEVVFNRLTGITSQSGDVSIRIKDDLTKNRTVYIEESGQVSLASPLVPSNSRVKDSRHVHFDYGRNIDTLTESLDLTFRDNGSSYNYNIVIADNLREGQIYWQGTVDAGGEDQELTIQTHRLNNPDTQFCIHRDRGYTRSLEIELSGDPGWSIIEYSLDGLSTVFTSIHVSNLIWQ
jgi:hypothetical protein